jgi:hypothetical protein
MASCWLKAFLTTMVLAVASGIGPAATAADCSAADHCGSQHRVWKPYRCYGSYASACRAASYLRSQGYQACIVHDDDRYEVWYR